MAYNFTPVAGRSYIQTPGEEWKDVTPIGSPFPQYYSNLSSALSGEFAPEVAANWDKLMAQKTAEQGWAMGIPGSQFSGYAGLYNYFQPLMQRMAQAEQQVAARYPYALQAAMQQRNLALHIQEGIRQRQAEQQARAAAAWGRGPFTPPLAQMGGGAPMRSVTQPTTRAMLSNIANKYAGTSAEPLRFAGERETPSFGLKSPMAYSGNVGQPILMAGPDTFYRGSVPAGGDVFEGYPGGGYSLGSFGGYEQAPQSYEDWWNAQADDWLAGFGAQ